MVVVVGLGPAYGAGDVSEAVVEGGADVVDEDGVFLLEGVEVGEGDGGDAACFLWGGCGCGCGCGGVFRDLRGWRAVIA